MDQPPIDVELLRARLGEVLSIKDRRRQVGDEEKAALDLALEVFRLGETSKGAKLAMRHALKLAELDDRDLGQYRAASGLLAKALDLRFTGDLFDE